MGSLRKDQVKEQVFLSEMTYTCGNHKGKEMRHLAPILTAMLFYHEMQSKSFSREPQNTQEKYECPSEQAKDTSA